MDSRHTNALRLGVSSDTGIGVCGHVGCGDSSANSRLASDLEGENPCLYGESREVVSSVVQNSGKSRIDEFPSVLFESAANTLTKKYIRISNELALVASSGGGINQKCRFPDVGAVAPLSYPMISSASVNFDYHITVSTRHMSPLLCLAGRKLWDTVGIILADKLSLRDVGRLHSSLSQESFYEEVYLCPSSKESSNNPAAEESTVRMMSTALSNNSRGVDIRPCLEGYFSAPQDKVPGENNLMPSNQQEAVGNFEFVGFLDFCLINEAPVDMMVQYLRYKLPAGMSLSYLDVTGVSSMFIFLFSLSICPYARYPIRHDVVRY